MNTLVLHNCSSKRRRVGAVFDVDVEDPFERPGPAHVRRHALCVSVLAWGLGVRSGGVEREWFYCATLHWALKRMVESSAKRAQAVDILYKNQKLLLRARRDSFAIANTLQSYW